MKLRLLSLSAGALALIGAAPAAVLWDTGAPHLVNLNGTDTFVGLSSGNVGATQPQRWLAAPFRAAAGGVIIDQVDADWFAPVGSEPATVGFVIWNRTGLTVPTTIAASGSLGPAGVGIDDPRVTGVDTFLHQYTGLNINLAAGDYYFTIYGAGIGTGNTTGFSNAAWLVGGDLQAEDLERDGAWRSEAFPTPGFLNYNPPNILPGAGMTDAEDRWNPSFTLYGTVVPEPATVLALTIGGLALLRKRRRN